MRYEESPWSKRNPGIPPRYTPFKERLLAGIRRAVEKDKKEREESTKPRTK